MHFSNLVLLASTGAASASIFSDAASFDFSSLIKRKAACPAYWQQISKDLNAAFLENGQCNANARAAVRYAFHDAGPYSTKLPFTAPAGGGADGSLLLNSGEMGRNENGGLEDYNTFIGNKLASYRSQFGSTVGAADLIQFASRYVYPGRDLLTTTSADTIVPKASQSSHALVVPKSRPSSGAPTAPQLPLRIACHPALVQAPTMIACCNSSLTKASQRQNSQP